MVLGANVGGVLCCTRSVAIRTEALPLFGIAAGEIQLFEAIQAKWAHYQQLHRRLIELSRSNRKREAADLYKGEVHTVYGEMNALIDQMLDINRNGGKS